MREVQKEVNDALEQDDLKWRLKAKEHWLKLGDKNTMFFTLVQLRGDGGILSLLFVMRMGLYV